MKLFSKLKNLRTQREIPQLTATERMAQEMPGVPPNSLPYSAYTAMEQDSMVHTALVTKKLAVLSSRWSIEAADETPDAEERAQFVRHNLERMQGSASSILRNAMDAFARGWSIQEVVYRLEQGRLWIESVVPKNPSLFGLELSPSGRPAGLTLQVPGESCQKVPIAKFVVYRNKAGYDAPKGRSDLDPAYPHWKSKQTLLGAWKAHMERYASPTVMARFQRGVSSSEQEGMLSALRQLRDNTAIIFPNDIDVSTLDSQSQASQGFMDAIEFHNREIARCVLGQTLTTDEGRRVGSLALGKVHLQVMLLQINAIRRELEDEVMTEQIIRPLIELNYGPGKIPRFRFEEIVLDAFSTGAIS